MKSYFFPLAMASLFLGGVASSVLSNENPISSNPAYPILMSSLTRDGFSPEEIKTMLVEVHFEKLTPEEVSWVIKEIPSVVSALKKNSLRLTQVNIGISMVLKEIKAEITQHNINACRKTFSKINALNKKHPQRFKYWKNSSFHLLGASFAIKKVRSEDTLKMLSHVDSKKLTSAEISEIIQVVNKSDLTSHKLEKSFDEIISKVKKESHEKKLPLRVPSEIEKRSPSEGLKALLIGKSLSKDSSLK